MSSALADLDAVREDAPCAAPPPSRRVEPSIRAHVLKLLERERHALIASIEHAERAHIASK